MDFATAPRAVAALARVTRPGGPIAVFVKVGGAGVAEGFEPYPVPGITDLPRFFTYYTPEEARALVEGAGLDVLDLTIAADGRPNAPDCRLRRSRASPDRVHLDRRTAI